MDHEFSADVADVAARLHAQRPELDPIDLDRLRRRLAAPTVAERPKRLSGRRAFVGSRLVVTMLLTFGIILGTTGAGLAVSGLSSAGSAGEGQYEQPGEEGGGTLGGEAEGQAPAGEVRGEVQQGGEQATGQVAAIDDGGGDTLPFTGFLAIPLILAGAAMLGSGLVLRRRT